MGTFFTFYTGMGPYSSELVQSEASRDRRPTHRGDIFFWTIAAALRRLGDEPFDRLVCILSCVLIPDVSRESC